MSSGHHAQSGKPTPEWAGLMQAATDIAPDGSPLTVAGIRAMEAHVQVLPGTDIEKAFYYGLGDTMCRMRPALSDPMGQHDIIQRGTDVIDTYHDSAYPSARGVVLKSIGKIGGNFVLPEAIAAVDDLSASERLLNEALGLAVFQLRHEVTLDDSIIQAELGRTSRIARTINNNMFEGAGLLLARYLELKAGRRWRKPQTLQDVTSYGELRAADFNKAATLGACLRNDEFVGTAQDKTSTFKRATSLNNAGQLIFDADVIKTTPPPRAPSGHPGVNRLSDERLRCPALRARLTQYAMPLFTEMVIGADARIAERSHQNRLATSLPYRTWHRVTQLIH